MQTKYKRIFTSIKNRGVHDILFKKMTAAYSHPHNLGNLLSYRELDDSNGPPVSLFVWL